MLKIGILARLGVSAFICTFCEFLAVFFHVLRASVLAAFHFHHSDKIGNTLFWESLELKAPRLCKIGLAGVI